MIATDGKLLVVVPKANRTFDTPGQIVGLLRSEDMTMVQQALGSENVTLDIAENCAYFGKGSAAVSVELTKLNTVYPRSDQVLGLLPKGIAPLYVSVEYLKRIAQYAEKCGVSSLALVIPPGAYVNKQPIRVYPNEQDREKEFLIVLMSMRRAHQDLPEGMEVGTIKDLEGKDTDQT